MTGFVQKKEKNRIFGLDITRAIAIILVVIAHTSGIFKLSNPPENIAARNDVAVTEAQKNNVSASTYIIPPATGNQQHILRHGRAGPLGVLGVELFFVLSGFLIGSILIKQFLGSKKFTLKDIKNFLVRRWLRTLPNYWFVLTILVIISYGFNLHGIHLNILGFYFFVQNLVTPHPNFFNEAWSLTIEEWFYLTIPFTIYCAAAIFRNADKHKLLLYTFSSYLLFFIVLRTINAFHPIYGADFDDGIRKIVIFRLDAIMYGVLIALEMRNKNSFLLRHKLPLLLLSIMATPVIIYFMYYFEAGYIHANSVFYIPFNCVFLYALLPFTFSLCLPYASVFSMKKLKPGTFERSVTYISRISYSIYLVHNNIFKLFFISHHAANYGFAVMLFILYISCVLAVSTLLYKFIEQPILRYRDSRYKASNISGELKQSG